MATVTGTGKAIIQDGSALTAVVHLFFKKDATFVLDAATVRVANQLRNSVPYRRPWLITRASGAQQVQTGFAPLVDRINGSLAP